MGEARDSEAQWDKAFGEAFSGEEPKPGSSVLERLGIRRDEGASIHLRDPDDESSPLVKAGEEAAGTGTSRYHVVGEIARGGVGVIFKGRDVDLGRDVAMKVLRKERADNPELIERFVEEAQVGGQLQHPGIVPVYEIGVQADGRPFFAMKLVKGKTLSALLSDRPTVRKGRRRLLTTFEQVCQTMAYAHARKVIHRDLKPSNIMVGAFGEVLVVDWGFAKVLREGGIADEIRAMPDLSIIETVRSGPGSDASLAGSVMGTPAYMSPEQARGDLARLDERADVFALGAILTEILSGKAPYPAEDGNQLVQAAKAELDGAFARLDACGADEDVVALAKRCLDPDPARRPRDASEIASAVAESLASVEERAEAARLDAQAAHIRAEGDRKRRRLAVALAGVTVIAVAIGAGAFLYVKQEQQERRDRVASQVTASLLDAREALGTARAADAADLAPWQRTVAVAEAAMALAEKLGADAESLGRTRRFLADAQAQFREARQRAEALERDGAARHRLTAVRMMIGADFEPAEVDNAFAEAFRAHGLEVADATVDEIVAYAASSRIREDLLGSLEHWAHVREAHEPDDVTGLHRLRESVRRLDPDPWRTKIRLLDDADDAKRVREIVAETDLEALPAASRLVLARALTHQGDLNEAYEVLEGLDGAGADVWICFEGAAAGLTSSNPNRETLRQRLEAALEVAPEAYGLRYHLATQLRAEDVEAAIAEFQLVWDQDPHYGTVEEQLLQMLRGRARRLFQSRSFAAAVKTARGILAIDEEDADAWTWLGRSLLLQVGTVQWHRPLGEEAQRKIDDSVAALTRAVKKGGTEGSALAILGEALFYARRWDKALETLERARETDATSRFYAATVLGKVHTARGDLRAAEAAYREAIAGGTGHRNVAYQGLDGILAGLGRHESRLVLARQMAGTVPVTYAHRILAGALITLGRYADAEAVLAPIVASYPRAGYGFHQLRGVAAARQGRLEDAIAHWKKMIALLDAGAARMRAGGQPGNFANQLARSIAATRTWLRGHDEASLWLVRRARERYADSPYLFNDEVYLLVSLGRADEALAMCVERLRSKPYDFGVGAITTAVLRNVRDLHARIQVYEADVKKANDDPFPWILLGLGRWVADDTDGAIEALDRLAERKPTVAAPHHWKALICLLAERAEEGEAACRELLSRDPDSVQGLQNLSHALKMQGRFDEARDACKKALAGAPDLFEFRSARGLVEFLAEGPEQGVRYTFERRLLPPSGAGSQPMFLLSLCENEHPEFAMRLLEDLLERHPDNVTNKIWYARFEAYTRGQGDLARAVRLAKEAVDKLPDSGLAWGAYAAVLGRAGRHAECLEAMKRAEALAPNLIEGLHGLTRATSLWHLGRQAEAKQALEEAVELQRRLGRARNFLAAELQPTPVWDENLKEARALIR